MYATDQTWAAVPELDKFPLLSLLCESNRYIGSVPWINPNIQPLTPLAEHQSQFVYNLYKI